ncbi:MAG: hypothetical protein ABIV94_11535 [Acidimicrobiales bacterium]
MPDPDEERLGQLDEQLDELDEEIDSARKQAQKDDLIPDPDERHWADPDDAREPWVEGTGPAPG